MQKRICVLVIGVICLLIAGLVLIDRQSLMGFSGGNSSTVTHYGITKVALELYTPAEVKQNGWQEIILHGAVWEDEILKPPDYDIEMVGGNVEVKGTRRLDPSFFKHFYHRFARHKGLILLGQKHPDALTYANEIWRKALDAYRRGKKPLAYHYLGRVAHLLEDQACPAHALLIPHVEDSQKWYRVIKNLPKDVKDAQEIAKEISKILDNEKRPDGFESWCQSWAYSRKNFGKDYPTTPLEVKSVSNAFDTMCQKTLLVTGMFFQNVYGDAEKMLSGDPPRRHFERNWGNYNSEEVAKVLVPMSTRLTAGLFKYFEKSTKR